MKKALLGLLILGAGLSAAEFWESKPYTTWNKRDTQKLLTNSPWAQQFTVPWTGGRGGRPPGAGGNEGPSGGGGRGGGGPRGGGDSSESEASVQTTWVSLSWQSALPLRHAQLRERFGDEVATSPQAAEFLALEVPTYVIAAGSLPVGLGRGMAAGELEKALQAGTSVTAKGKAPVKPVAVQVEPGGRTVLFGFPRTTPFVLEDQEVEFAMDIGQLHMKHKFRLKDMVYKGKLEL